MQEFTFHKVVDAEALHQQMKAALADLFVGVSVTGDTVVVHLNDGVQPAQLDTMRTLISAHDVSTLPPKPTPKSIEQRFTELEARLRALEQKPGETGTTL